MNPHAYASKTSEEIPDIYYHFPILFTMCRSCTDGDGSVEHGLVLLTINEK